jgi:hypothetical protein
MEGNLFVTGHPDLTRTETRPVTKFSQCQLGNELSIVELTDSLVGSPIVEAENGPGVERLARRAELVVSSAAHKVSVAYLDVLEIPSAETSATDSSESV